VCDDPPVAGLAKLCEQSYVFGRQSRMTRVFELDRLGLTTNRGEFYDFNLVGNPVQGAGPNDQIPSVPGGGTADQINSEIGKQMFELAVAWGRDFGPRIFTGNPTNNTSGGGDKYYPRPRRADQHRLPRRRDRRGLRGGRLDRRNYASQNVSTATMANMVVARSPASRGGSS
jgi:hypothetical protein